jgi:hypothetical protein
MKNKDFKMPNISEEELGILENLMEAGKPLISKFLKPLQDAVEKLLGDDDVWVMLRKINGEFVILIIDASKVGEVDIPTNAIIPVLVSDIKNSLESGDTTFIDELQKQVKEKFNL